MTQLSPCTRLANTHRLHVDSSRDSPSRDPRIATLAGPLAAGSRGGSPIAATLRVWLSDSCSGLLEPLTISDPSRVGRQRRLADARPPRATRAGPLSLLAPLHLGHGLVVLEQQIASDQPIQYPDRRGDPDCGSDDESDHHERECEKQQE